MATRHEASRTEIPAPRFEPGAQEAGWRIERVLALEEIRARLYLARHEESGARLAHVHCHDPENLFSVGFLTPPDDSRGTPHVLEHCVLAGSERYPVKDAFAELDRRSLATFLNAFTWPDRTIYPVSSAVQPDYFNLAEVYGDLVFRPLLRDETFWQEGVHLAPRDPDGESEELVWAGVVYNEMRGAYSAPEEVIERTLRQRLLPETIYRFDSGGDPDEIPALTAEQLRAFHRRCYTAENARFFLYGDVEPARNLALCAELLERAPRAAAPPLPALQPRWSEPRQVTLRYPVAPGGETRGRSFCVLAWLGPETTSAETVLALDVVLEALVGSAAGPLRRALIDAGLGADLYPSHPFDTEQRQTIVRVGLRGTETAHADAIERLVLETLERVVREGLDRELVEASLHQVELAGREISQHFPVTLLTRVGRLWFYDGDPADGLRFGEQIARLRERIATEPGWLEALIRTWLLDNPHRLRLVAEPDPELAGRREAALRARLAEIAAKLDEQERAALRARAKRLRELQQRPDPPEALATLPTLSPEQIPPEVRRVPTEPRRHDALQVLEHPIFANGMVYVGIGFPVTDVPEHALPWLPILGAATTGMGAAGLDYQQMARRLLACTGGVGTELHAATRLDTSAPSEWLFVDGKALARNGARLCEILGDLVTAPDPSDTRRLADLVREAATQAEAAVVPRGSRLATLAAAAVFGRAHRRRECWSGVSQLRFLRELAADIDARAAEVSERIAALQRRLFVRRGAIVSVAADPEVLEALRPEIASLIERLPETAPAGEQTASEAEACAAAGSEAGAPVGIAAATEVAFVAELLPVPRIGAPEAPALELLAHQLSLDYLYQRLRVEGGAYGGWCSYLWDDGLLALVSYRDPEPARTLRTYAELLVWAREHVTESAIASCRLGAIRAQDRVLSPEAMMSVARRRHVIGLEDELRQALREGVLRLGAEAVRERALPALERGFERAHAAALADRRQIEQAADALGLRFEIIDAG